MRDDMETLKFHNWEVRFSLRSACSLVKSSQSVHRKTVESIEKQ